MNNRNLLLFIVLSVAMLGTYSYLMNRLYPPKPIAQVVPEPAPAVAPVSVQLPVHTGVRTSIDAKSVFTLSTQSLELSWRKQDGALVQVVWKQDGTKFFPWEHKGKDDHLISMDFIGIGGAMEARFDGDPQVLREGSSQQVLFQNAVGDVLSYGVPDTGHIVNVNYASKGDHLFLIRALKDNPKLKDAKGEEYEASPLHNLGEVFTLEGKGIERVAWSSILKDPFFSFLGFKRKELPPTDARLGLDAGIDKIDEAARTHYFAAIWDCSVTPERDTSRHLGFHAAPKDGKVSARLYLGPKQTEQLAAFGEPFTRVMNFGFFGMVAKAMFWILRWLNRFIPNWGWTIVVFSVLLRLAMWSLNTKTTIQMLRMKDLEPHQKIIQARYEKFGNDMTKKAEMQKELMAFYKKNGHNPMGGCLPMLLQMPVFFALWSMLNAVFELRHAPFLGYIHDLAAQDPMYIMPVLLGASMVAQQAMTPATGDPAQRKMMMILTPAMMVFFFAKTPAGLCLYYLIFNLIGMSQAWWVKRNYKPQPVVV
jgi:YidC/Oxa1 family membrane protein insertase